MKLSILGALRDKINKAITIWIKFDRQNPWLANMDLTPAEVMELLEALKDLEFNCWKALKVIKKETKLDQAIIVQASCICKRQRILFHKWNGGKVIEYYCHDCKLKVIK